MSNTMRTLAIGDIHGCSMALDALLDAVAPTPDDTVIVLGDVIDWGPDSRGVVERIIACADRFRLVALRGNHEEMAIEARHDRGGHRLWLKLGGQAAIESYGSAGIPDSHYDFFERACRDIFETETHVFVHGGLDPNLPLDRQPVATLRWKAFQNPTLHPSGKTMICGHTEQRDGRPRAVPGAVCIDTAACRGGWLTCLDVGTGQYWQANQRREVRKVEKMHLLVLAIWARRRIRCRSREACGSRRREKRR